MSRFAAYLLQSSLGGADLVHHPQGDANHGGEGQQPTDGVAPPRVHIDIVVLQRSVFNEGEGEGSLQRQTRNQTKYGYLK